MVFFSRLLENLPGSQPALHVQRLAKQIPNVTSSSQRSTNIWEWTLQNKQLDDQRPSICILPIFSQFFPFFLFTTIKFFWGRTVQAAHILLIKAEHLKASCIRQYIMHNKWHLWCKRLHTSVSQITLDENGIKVAQIRTASDV